MSQFHCVLGNRDFLKIVTPTGIEKQPVWRYVEGQQHWLTSLAYLKGIERAPGTYFMDCGAWSYKLESDPRWTPSECIGLYATFSETGDLVAAPDHMVLRTHDAAEERRRIDLTLANTREFLRLCPPHLRPIAVTHGSTLEARRQMLHAYLEMGYRHIAIGGVAGQAGNRRAVHEILADTARACEQQRFYIHVLGISALSWVPEFRTYGVDSFDGSSAFFAAFTAGQWYWHTGDGAITKYAVKSASGELPTCDCPPCDVMRAQGVDTRGYGSNETNMGRAVHNINQYLRALACIPVTPPIRTQAASALLAYQPTLWELAS